MALMSETPPCAVHSKHWKGEEADLIVTSLFAMGLLGNIFALIYFNCRDRKKITLFTHLMTLFLFGHILMTGFHVSQSLLGWFEPILTCDFLPIGHAIHR